MYRIRERLLRGGLCILAHMPWWFIRVLTAVGYVLIYRLLRYRVSVVRSSLFYCFPEKTAHERKTIEQEFYRHFVFQIFSSVKLLSLPREVLAEQYLSMTGLEVFAPLLAQGHRCFIVLMGHCGNWELFSAGQIYFDRMGIQQDQLYRPMKDPLVDRLLVDLRTRYGSRVIPKGEIGRRILSLYRQPEERPVVFGFIADQTPSYGREHYWTRFLSRPTPFLDGAERLARKYNIPVLYMDIERTGELHYTGRIRLISEAPQESEPYQITERYARLLEESILRQPAYWLWTHKRWKHSLQGGKAVLSPELQTTLNRD